MKRDDAGVTLLELIIAISLLGLLSLAILTALRVGVNGMVKANARLMDNRRAAGAQRILEDQIAGFMPVIANCQPADPDGPVVRLPFFQGEPQSMRFVSSYSLGEGWRGMAQVLEFQVTAGAPGEGVRLIVNEHAYTGSVSAGVFCLGTAVDEEASLQVPQFRPIIVGPQSFVLADRLASCRFSYRQTLPAPAGERWVERWIFPVWPNAVRVDMVPLEPDRARIQPLSLIAPMRVNAEPGAGYGG